MEHNGKMLLMIDPQVDFITGTLPVPGAEDAMNALANYIGQNKETYSVIGVSLDWHPMNHCSFKSAGGDWPDHCMQHSTGAAIWPPLMNALTEVGSEVRMFTKGTDVKHEEYSVFRNKSSRKEIIELVKEKDILQIDICGLAGDICVLSSLEDAVKALHSCHFRVLLDFSPSIGTDKRLANFCKDKEIEYCTGF